MIRPDVGVQDSIIATGGRQGEFNLTRLKSSIFAGVFIRVSPRQGGQQTCRVREANRGGNGGLRTEPTHRKRVPLLWTGPRNAP